MSSDIVPTSSTSSSVTGAKRSLSAVIYGTFRQPEPHLQMLFDQTSAVGASEEPINPDGQMAYQVLAFKSFNDLGDCRGRILLPV